MRARAGTSRLWFRFRGLLMVPPVIVMLLCTWHETESRAVVLPAGLAAFAAGMLLRLWSQVHLHYRLRLSKVLTTTGPYRFVRNPVYIGNTLILAGLCLLSELVWLLPFLVPYCAIVYSFVVRYEESHLTAKYGQAYTEYLRSVPRWVPRATPLAAKPTSTKAFLVPSILSELHVLLLLLLPLSKEFILFP